MCVMIDVCSRAISYLLSRVARSASFLHLFLFPLTSSRCNLHFRAYQRDWPMQEGNSEEDLDGFFDGWGDGGMAAQENGSSSFGA